MGTVSKMERRKALLTLGQHPAAATILTGPTCDFGCARLCCTTIWYGGCHGRGSACAASVPNFFIVELPNAGAGSATLHDGFCALPKGPGLGIDVNEKELERNQIT
jgi:hypothetical protein